MATATANPRRKLPTGSYTRHFATRAPYVHGSCTTCGANPALLTAVVLAFAPEAQREACQWWRMAVTLAAAILSFGPLILGLRTPA